MTPKSITEQSRLFSRYTFKVITGRYKIIDNRSDSEPKVRQIATADGEDEARMIVEALNATEQHSTLIAQRERLLAMLKQFVSPTQCYCDKLLYGSESRQCGQCEARELIATSEQEGRHDDAT